MSLHGTKLNAVNVEFLRLLKDVSGSKQNLAASIIEMYLNESEELFSEILTAASDGQMAICCERLQTLAGACASVGARRLQDLCVELSKVDPGLQLDRLHAEFYAVEHELAFILMNLKTPSSLAPKQT